MLQVRDSRREVEAEQPARRNAWSAAAICVVPTSNVNQFIAPELLPRNNDRLIRTLPGVTAVDRRIIGGERHSW
jgi:hypothetical protein